MFAFGVKYIPYRANMQLPIWNLEISARFCYSTRMNLLIALLLAVSSAPDGLADGGDCIATNLSDAVNRPLPAPGGRVQFRVSGQVFSIMHGKMLLCDGAICTPLRLTATDQAHLRVGDIVQVKGYGSNNELGLRHLTPVSISVIGHRPLPQPVDTDNAQLSSGSITHRYARMRGVVAAAFRDELDSRFNWFLLRTSSGSANVACPEEQIPLQKLKNMTDAEVVATGIAIPFANWRAYFGNYLQLVETNAIEVVHAATTDPYLAPPLGDEPTPHRVRVSGLVLAATREFFFLRTSQRALVRVRPSEGTLMPPSGTTVEASGFANRTAGGHIVFDAAVRQVAAESAALTMPGETDPEALFTDANGIRKIDVNHNGQTVRLKGIVRLRPESFDQSKAFLLECGTHTFTVDTSGIPNAPDDVNPKPGSTVMVAGLCIADFREDAVRMGFPHFMGYSLIPRTASDIRVLAQPPWWTIARLSVVVCILLVAIVAFAIWNRLLHRYAERRGRELYREKIAHTRAQLKVEERTRLAVELHDSISQSLAGVAMHIDSASRADAAGGNAGAFLNTARQLLASCRRELQSCLWDLRSRTFEERDMKEAIERAGAPHAGDTKIKIRFNLPRAKLLETTTHTILYIIRELVVNAVRHGHATSIRIAGSHDGGQLLFSVADNGRGFAPKDAPGPLQGHFGLQGIRERIKPFRGKMEIESETGKGTHVKILMTISEMRNEDEE